MSGLQAIDVGLGLMFIYLILSLVCTAANELIAGLLQMRRRNLEKGLKSLLTHEGDANLLEIFKNHALLKSLYGEKFKPSYLPPGIFASVLLDLIHPADPHTPRQMADIREGINRFPNNSALKHTFRVLIHDAENDIQRLRRNIESWYNEAMICVSGWYKTKTQYIIFFIALVITGLANADTIQLAKAFSQDPQLLAAVVIEAKKITASANLKETSSDIQKLKEIMKPLEKSGIPLGWEEFPSGNREWVSKIFGLFITALAVSLGAPFWFDMLKKVVNVRAGSLSPEDIEKQKKKDT